MREPTATTPAARRAAFVVMCAGYFLVLLDVTIVNVALPRIASGLHAHVSGLQWVVDGYAIALAALMLGGGTIGDLHGHKRVVLVGFALFGLASLGCGLAPDPGVLVSFRVLQGVGAALMLPGTLAVITASAPDAGARARAIGIWAAIGSAALPAGPIVGGALTELVSWRAVFFLNVPIALAAIAIAARTVRESRDRERRRLDGPGIVLGATLLGLASFAFIDAGHGGVSAPVAVAIAGAVAAGIGLVLVERTRADPMLPPALLRRRDFSIANALAGTMNFATLGLLFVLTLYLQDVRHLSALHAGVALLPLFLPLSVIAPLGGRVTGQFGPRWPMLVGLVLAAGGFALLASAGRGSSYLSLLPALLLWGIGLAALTPAVVAAAVGAVASDRAGLASAVNNTARQAAGAIGVAAFGGLAGAPTAPGFLHGFHLAALIAAGLFAAGAVATSALS
jgi:MFS transporter, DHA2 family, methylenomycin A resistance protein